MRLGLSSKILCTLCILGLLAYQRLLAQSGPSLNIQSSANSQLQITWQPGNNFNVLQETLGLGGTNVWQDVSDAPSVLGALYAVRKATTNSAAYYRLIQRGMPGVTTPPDPASVATPLLPNVYNDFGGSTAFLYTGPNPIQIGVAPGTIQAVQAAVLRGTVRGRDNAPLSGVRVALLNHPEFGYTYTRTNGMFDLAVNAAQYTVDFQAIGYLEVQRQASVAGHSYYTLPDVAMIALDPMATVVTLGSNAPAQMAASTPQTDESGTRSATVFIPTGTTATLVMPDGSTQAMNTMTVRVTEYTVGANGPAAMPASLPPNSGYTYCAEFTADEELAAGANNAVFSQPLPVYVDNFLNVPVGTLVPVGSYNHQKGVWVPSSNGLVIEVLGSSNGIAVLDLHGLGQPETADTLAANGFTTQELQQLATLYPSGKTLWRCPVPHFSSWDFNFGSFPPDPKKPNKPGDKPYCPECDNSPPSYGTLNFSAQTFTEQIPLVGVPFDLNYNSARVPDYRVKNELTIPVAWQPPQIPPCNAPDGGVCAVYPNPYFFPPSAILVETEINGEQTSQTLPATNKVATISWDGRDAYGRLVGGTRQADINIAYEFTNQSYFGVSGGPDYQQAFPALFGNDGNLTSFEGHKGTTLGVGADFKQLLTCPDHRALGFGGWSPTVLHRWDPVGGILYYGDGRIRSVAQASSLGGFQSQITGNPQRVVAAAADGSIYFAGPLTISGDSENFIFRRLPGGTFQIITASIAALGAVYPNGEDWSKIDGQPVDKVSFGNVNLAALCVGPDGSVYVTDSFVIARLTPDGIWHVILGLNAAWPPTLQPDGGPAQNSYATSAGRVVMAVGPDSSVYFTTSWSQLNGTNYNMIRKIAPDGNLYTVFGASGSPVSLETSPVYWNTLYSSVAYAAPYAGGPIAAIAVGSDGTIYVSPGESGDGGGMFKISPAGVILPFLSMGPVTGAGAGYNPNNTNNAALIQGDEGRQATQVTSGANSAVALAVGPDGSVYFTCDIAIVWRVNPNGILERVAGRYGSTAYNGPNLPSDGADPLNTYLYPVNALAVTQDNTLALVRANTTPYIMLYPGRSAQQGVFNTPVETQKIPSEDGSEVYVFSQDGRHLSTLDGLTGATKWAFGYDTNALVVTLTDAVGLVTAIERDGAGNPTAIVGPYGQRTTLGLDANGFLSKVTNPANENISLANSSGGLLLSIKRPLGDSDNIYYDNLGRAIQVTDPINGGWTDARTEVGVLSDYSYEADIACTNSVGDTLSRQLLLRPNGDTDVSYSEGRYLTETAVFKLSGDGISYFSDGSILSTAVGADPRFGRQADQDVKTTLSLPGGLAYNESIQRTAGLTNPVDPFSLTGLTDVTTINGNSYTDFYNVTNRTDTFTSPEGRMNIAVSDALGRIIHEVSPGQPIVDTAYDNSGRIATLTSTSSAGVSQTAFSYDTLGQLSTLTDPLGRTNAFSYDAAGRLNQVTQPDGSVIGFNHDSEGHLTSLTPPGRPAHTFQYNAAGLVTKYIPPFVTADESVAYQYDSERNPTQVNLPDGQTIALQYGVGGRVEQATVGAGPTLNYHYGTNFGSGYLSPVNVTSSTGDSIQFGYVGSILTNVSWSGSITGQVSVQLNSDLLPISQSVDGTTIAFAYDHDRLLTQAGDMTITRDHATGFVTGTTLGTVTDQRQFDDRGLLTNYTASVNGAPIWSKSLSYDLVGRLTNNTENIGGSPHSFGYVYDLGGRLQQVWQDGLVATTYTYDGNGNRLSKTDGSGTVNASYDAQDRLVQYGNAIFSYSANGDLTNRSGANPLTSRYDALDNMLQVRTTNGDVIDYVMDAGRRRVGKKKNQQFSQAFLYQDRLKPVAQLDAQNSIVSRFVFGTGLNAPDYMLKGTNTYRILGDQQGSVRLVVDTQSGTVIQRLDYDEFGQVTQDTNPGFQPFGYAGGLYDADTGLVHFGVRDYDATTGMWAQRDLLKFGGGSPNLYTYCDNDPLNRMDSLGTEDFTVWLYNELLTISTIVGGVGYGAGAEGAGTIALTSGAAVAEVGFAPFIAGTTAAAGGGLYAGTKLDNWVFFPITDFAFGSNGAGSAYGLVLTTSEAAELQEILNRKSWESMHDRKQTFKDWLKKVRARNGPCKK